MNKLQEINKSLTKVKEQLNHQLQNVAYEQKQNGHVLTDLKNELKEANESTLQSIQEHICSIILVAYLI